tara:strand:+ start:309 stop:641 length:333 start_codon:yes stop_codon:yes gene_type:complete
MIHAILFSTDNQYENADERIELQDFTSQEEFINAKRFYSYYDNGASHHLLRIDEDLSNKFLALDWDSKRIELFHSIDWKNYRPQETCKCETGYAVTEHSPNCKYMKNLHG